MSKNASKSTILVDFEAFFSYVATFLGKIGDLKRKKYSCSSNKTRGETQKMGSPMSSRRILDPVPWDSHRAHGDIGQKICGKCSTATLGDPGRITGRNKRLIISTGRGPPPSPQWGEGGGPRPALMMRRFFLPVMRPGSPNVAVEHFPQTFCPMSPWALLESQERGLKSSATTLGRPFFRFLHGVYWTWRG